MTLVRTAAVAAIAMLPAALSAQRHARERAVDSLMVEYARPGMPGASVLVVQDGRVAYARGYGLAEVETKRAVTPATNFRLASLSKQFTATAVMLLEAQGRLRYEDPIGPLVPALPPYARGVTIRQLLTHTSGLPDYEDFVPAAQTTQVRDADVPALITGAPGPKFAPGERYDYSNTGYALLALAVERASGQRYASFLRERVFAPLGMRRTVAHEAGRSTVARRAYGYTVDSSGAVRRTDQSNTSAVLGDGGIYSSAADLVKWDAALERHALVGASAQELAWTPATLSGGAATRYGFGWFVDDAGGGTKRLSHHGESRGFTNAILRYPARRITVVVLTNRTGGAPWELAERIAEVYGGR